jgi:hypothetical protein
MRTRALILAALSFAQAAMAQEIVVTGAVGDFATQRPLPGAIVQLIGGGGSVAARADEAGGFLFHLPAGKYQLAVRRIGYLPIDSVITVNALPIKLSMHQVVQTLKPVLVAGEGAGIYGEIASVADLAKIKGARVQVAGGNATAQTDSAGSFFIPLKHPGTYALRVTAPGYAMDFFTVSVAENEVADASRLLIVANKGNTIPEMVWQEFDQRLRWRSPMASVFASGADVRRVGGATLDAIEALAARSSAGMRLDATICVLVDGIPHQGMDLDEIQPEEIKAMEIYGSGGGGGAGSEVMSFLAVTWPKGKAVRCSETGKPPVHFGTRPVRFVSIWTK